jgi:hypothetical protein
MEPEFDCTQRFHATNVHKRSGSAAFVLKLMLATPSRGSLPYIFPELLPLPQLGQMRSFLYGNQQGFIERLARFTARPWHLSSVTKHIMRDKKSGKNGAVYK